MMELENKLSLIIAIVNGGYSDEVVETSKTFGARGGTIINGLGSYREEAIKIYGITPNEEKEIIMIVVKSDIKDNVLKAIYEKNGKTTSANAVAFSIPISNATSNLTSQYLTNTD